MSKNILASQHKAHIIKLLEELFWGTTNGYIPIWCKLSRQSRFVHVSDIAGAARQILSLCHSDDVYVGRGLQGSVSNSGSRGGNDGVTFVGGVFLDSDTQEGSHGSADNPKDPNTLPVNTEEVLRILQRCGLPEPTLVVHTGGGCHIHHLYEDPQQLLTDEQRNAEAALSKAFQDAVRAEFKKHNYTLDHTADLARVCRPPNTLNHKDEPAKPVRLLAVGPRVDRAVIERWVAERVPPAFGKAVVPRLNESMHEIVDAAHKEAKDKYLPANRDKLTSDAP